jgi:ABC-type antimicrobial peptide transport system permease subunit
MLAEARFAFGAALVMALAGTAVAFGMPPIRLMPSEEPAVRWFVQAAVGFGLGWWGGLFWGTALVFYARNFRPVPPVAALMPATVFAGTAIAAVALATRTVGASVLLSIGAGVVAGTLAARLIVSRAARKVRQ